MRILFIGEIVAKPGRKTVAKVLPDIISGDSIDVVVANIENLAHGRGATEKTVREMMEVGVNCFTGGDHLFRNQEFEEVIDSLPVVRPANYPEGTSGVGWKVIEVGKSERLLLINLMGRTFLNEYLDNPFTKADEILQGVKDEKLVSVVDFHAQATSEKYALAFYLDGRVNAVVGTHTHVPTCDQRVLPKGTMFVCDAGMTGSADSVLGVEKEIIMDRFLKAATNQRFEWEEEGLMIFSSVLMDTKVPSISRIDKYI